MAAYTLITPPAAEPVTPSDAKAHMRVQIADDDAYIAALITAARKRAEEYLGGQFVQATWDWFLDRFPVHAGALIAPKTPLLSVDSITYVDSAGDSQTLATTEYDVDAASQPGRIKPAYAKTWPVTRPQMNAVTVRIVAGYGDAPDVPESIKQAIMMLVAHWYENREAVSMSAMPEVPMSFAWLLDGAWTGQI